MPQILAKPSGGGDGLEIPVRLSGGDELEFTVHSEFTPVTMAQIFTAFTPADTPSHIPPSSLIILKVFDPKYYSHRLTPRGVPWTLAAESSAASTRTAPFDPDFKPWDCPEEEDLVGWEEWYHQQSEHQFRAESQAYERLVPLQGTAIPRCFGTGTRSLAAEQRVISPHVLLLEYIEDAKTLADIDPSVVDRSLGLSLLETARRFGELGVVHTDLNPGNILFSPTARPTRAVVIDFGSAGRRQDEDSEDYWREVLSENNEVHWMAVELKRSLNMTDLM